MPATIEYSVYLVRCRNGSLYTGIAKDVARRFAEHEGGVAGAKYLRGRGPLKLVFQHSIGARGLALRIEHRIKQLSRKEKSNFRRLPDFIDALILDLADQS